MNRYRRYLNIMLLMGLIAPMTAPASDTDKYALLIGVSKYNHVEMNKPEPLKYPEEDTKALGELFQSGGYEVDLLLGPDATQKAIREKMEGLKKKANADGVVLIGLFGHGIDVETIDEDKNINRETGFCPVDTTVRIAKDLKGRDIYGPNKQKQFEVDPESMVKISEITNSLGLAKAGHRVLLLDCSRSIPNQARGFGAGLSVPQLPDHTAVLFSCSKGEMAYEHQDWRGGAYPIALLKEIPAMSKEGSVTMGTLSDRVQRRVSKMVDDTVNGRSSQTPLLWCTESIDLQWQPKLPE